MKSSEVLREKLGGSVPIVATFGVASGGFSAKNDQFPPRK